MADMPVCRGCRFSYFSRDGKDWYCAGVGVPSVPCRSARSISGMCGLSVRMFVPRYLETEEGRVSPEIKLAEYIKSLAEDGGLDDG